MEQLTNEGEADRVYKQLQKFDNISVGRRASLTLNFLNICISLDLDYF